MQCGWYYYDIKEAKRKSFEEGILKVPQRKQLYLFLFLEEIKKIIEISDNNPNTFSEDNLKKISQLKTESESELIHHTVRNLFKFLQDGKLIPYLKELKEIMEQMNLSLDVQNETMSSNINKWYIKQMNE